MLEIGPGVKHFDLSEIGIEYTKSADIKDVLDELKRNNVDPFKSKHI